RARLEARDRRHQEQVDAWVQASADAALAGEEPPPAPAEPAPLANNPPYFEQRRRKLTEHRDRLLLELAPEVEARLFAREEELLDAAKGTAVAGPPPMGEGGDV